MTTDMDETSCDAGLLTLHDQSASNTTLQELYTTAHKQADTRSPLLQSMFQRESSFVRTAIGMLTLEVGRDGGYAHNNDLAFSVPEGAVDKVTTLIARLYIDDACMPPVEPSQFVFSPVLSLEPHKRKFKKPIQVRFDFTAVSQYWVIKLLRADCSDCELPSNWKTVLEYNTDTGIVSNWTDDCHYYPDRKLLMLSHFCKHCFVGEPLYNSLMGQKEIHCSAFGYKPNDSMERWTIKVYLHDRCRDIFEEIFLTECRQAATHYLLDGPEPLIISRWGSIGVTIKGDSWTWKIEESDKTISSKSLWRKWSENRVRLIVDACLKPGIPEANVGEMSIVLKESENSETLCLRVALLANQTEVHDQIDNEGRQQTRHSGFNREITDLECLEVSKIALNKWRDIALHLHFASEELVEYETRRPRSLKDCLYDILLGWKRRDGKKATVAVLLDACKRAGIEGAVRKVLQEQGASHRL